MPIITRKTNLGVSEDIVLGTVHPGTADTIVGLVKSSAAGTLHIEQSADGTNWDLDTTVAVTANTGVSFEAKIFGSQVRLRYTNGPAATTFFRLTAKTSSSGPR